MSGLAGRTALVTGSTRGVGRSIARRLSDEGVRVVVHGRDEEAVAELVAELRGAVGVTAEISDPGAVRAMCREAIGRVGQIDIVVNNAGTSVPARFLDTPEDVWQNLFAVNFEGPRNVLRETLPGMQEQHWGRVLNVVSVAAIEGTPGFSAYAASKGALLSLSRTLADEMARFGICVRALAPLALTDLVKSQLSPGNLAKLTSRGLPTPEQCADTAVQLISDDAPGGHLTVLGFIGTSSAMQPRSDQPDSHATASPSQTPPTGLLRSSKVSGVPEVGG